MIRYFEWMGAAQYTAERRSGAMHGKVFLMDSIYGGIDEKNVYGRIDFAEPISEGEFEIVVNLESWAEKPDRPPRALRLNVGIQQGKISTWRISDNGDVLATEASTTLMRNFEFKLPLSMLDALPRKSAAGSSEPATSKLRLRFSIWQNHLPVDALPVEGWMELQLLPEEELIALAH
jgi:hypothetical protein